MSRGFKSNAGFEFLRLGVGLVRDYYVLDFREYVSLVRAYGMFLDALSIMLEVLGDADKVSRALARLGVKVSIDLGRVLKDVERDVENRIERACW